MKNEASPALQYWQSELATKGEATRQKYQEYFNEFLEFIGKNPDELIAQRQQDLLNPDRKIQRRIESQLLAFIAKKKLNGYAIATQQIYFASIRSFFEIHYFPLIMRRGDYPKGDSNGVKRATKEAIIKVELDEYCEKIFGYLAFNFEKPHYLNKFQKELKDSGIRISKPTLILHLRHLKEMKIIKKRKEGKQKLAISLNYDCLIDVEFYKKFHTELESLLNEKKMFNDQTIEKRVKIASACLYVIETNRLKYEILKTLEPKKNFEYSIAFQFIKNTLRHYIQYLRKACLESEANAKQALKVIEALEKNWHDAITEELTPT